MIKNHKQCEYIGQRWLDKRNQIPCFNEAEIVLTFHTGTQSAVCNKHKEFALNRIPELLKGYPHDTEE